MLMLTYNPFFKDDRVMRSNLRWHTKDTEQEKLAKQNDR